MRFKNIKHERFYIKKGWLLLFLQLFRGFSFQISRKNTKDTVKQLVPFEQVRVNKKLYKYNKVNIITNRRTKQKKYSLLKI